MRLDESFELDYVENRFLTNSFDKPKVSTPNSYYTFFAFFKLIQFETAQQWLASIGVEFTVAVYPILF